MLAAASRDADYKAVGAEIVSDKKALFDRSEMIVKVKEPLESEYDLFHEGQILFTYLHLAAEPELTKALLQKRLSVSPMRRFLASRAAASRCSLR